MRAPRFRLEGTVLVVTPWQDGIEKLRYLITWRQAGRRYQGAVEQGIALGQDLVSH